MALASNPRIEALPRAEVKASNDARCATLDARTLMAWMEVLTAGAFDSVICRQSHDAAFLARLIHLKARAIVQDRAFAAADADVRTALPAAHDPGSDGGAAAAGWRNPRHGQRRGVRGGARPPDARPYQIGGYIDIGLREAGAPKLHERRCVCDNPLVPPALCIPALV